MVKCFDGQKPFLQFTHIPHIFVCQLPTTEMYFTLREGQIYQIGWIFLGKFQRGGGGVIINPKIYIADFRNFNQGIVDQEDYDYYCSGDDDDDDDESDVELVSLMKG